MNGGRGGGRSGLAAIGLVALAACAPALKPPPPVAVLGGTAAGDASSISGPVPQLLADAEREFAHRPDMAAASLAYRTFLAAARADDQAIDGLLGAARVAAWILEHDTDADRRDALSAEAVQVSQWCVARAPSSTECRYRLALAIGQQAREHRSTAKDGMAKMTALLEQVIAADPRLDKAGAHRALALLLLRAPGWPAGPGDPDAALVHAHRADELFPDDADNLTVLAEALAATGDPDEARATYERARALASERAAAGDPDAADVIAATTRALEKLGHD